MTTSATARTSPASSPATRPTAPRATRCAARYDGHRPEADLVAVKTADDHGNSTVLDVINALEFVVDHKDELNIDVVNLSVSSDTPGSYLTDPLDAAVEFAWHAGIVVVAAAGNRGDAADAVQYAPGNDPFVISVGATDETGTADPADDIVATFSSRGVTQDGFNKPDVVAPGAASSPRWPPAPRSSSCARHCVVDGEYLQHRRHLDGRPGRRRRRGAAPPGPPGPQPGPGQGAADRATSTRPPTSTRELDVSQALHANVGRGANQGVRPNADRRRRAGRGRRRPDPRHLDQGDLDEGHLDQGHLDEGDLDQGHLDRRPSPPRGRRPPGRATAATRARRRGRRSS